MLTELLTALLTEFRTLVSLLPLITVTLIVVYALHTMVSLLLTAARSAWYHGQLTALRADIVTLLCAYQRSSAVADRDRIYSRLTLLKIRYDAIVNVSGLYAESAKLTASVKELI